MNLQRYLSFSPAIATALRKKKPIVAFESASVLCALPINERMSCLEQIQQTTHRKGAEPAVIAILEGIIHIGLSSEQLNQLCRIEQPAKLSRRDLPVALATQMTGAVSAAAGMIAAMLAGIRVFSTPVIGGVRPQSLDISADLQELSSSGLAVICSGVSYGANAQATAEHLETNGVPVLGLLPQTKTDGEIFFQPTRFVNLKQAAEIAYIKRNLGLSGGVLLTINNSFIPHISLQEYRACLMQAQQSAEAKAICGQALSSYITAYFMKHCPSASNIRVQQACCCAAHASEIAAQLIALQSS